MKSVCLVVRQFIYLVEETKKSSRAAAYTNRDLFGCICLAFACLHFKWWYEVWRREEINIHNNKYGLVNDHLHHYRRHLIHNIFFAYGLLFTHAEAKRVLNPNSHIHKSNTYAHLLKLQGDDDGHHNLEAMQFYDGILRWDLNKSC